MHLILFNYFASMLNIVTIAFLWFIAFLLMMVILPTLPVHSSAKLLPERELHAHLVPSAAYFLRKSHLVNSIQAVTAGLNADLLLQKEVSVGTAL